jgi:hypothetical protein
MLIGKVEETRAICPHCGTSRKAKILSQLDGSEDSASRTLQELGIPPGEVLSVRAGEHLRLYELTDDVERFWA